MSEAQGFKRINFFKGFLTTEKDWNDAERYHIDKRRLHNKMMHSPGIVYGYSMDLKVSAIILKPFTNDELLAALANEGITSVPPAPDSEGGSS